jgi:hypothetical protein
VVSGWGRSAPVAGACGRSDGIAYAVAVRSEPERTWRERHRRKAPCLSRPAGGGAGRRSDADRERFSGEWRAAPKQTGAPAPAGATQEGVRETGGGEGRGGRRSATCARRPPERTTGAWAPVGCCDESELGARAHIAAEAGFAATGAGLLHDGVLGGVMGRRLSHSRPDRAVAAERPGIRGSAGVPRTAATSRRLRTQSCPAARREC